MVGQAALNRSIGVRLPVSQPRFSILQNLRLTTRRLAGTRTNCAHRTNGCAARIARGVMFAGRNERCASRTSQPPRTRWAPIARSSGRCTSLHASEPMVVAVKTKTDAQGSVDPPEVEFSIEMRPGPFTRSQRDRRSRAFRQNVSNGAEQVVRRVGLVQNLSDARLRELALVSWRATAGGRDNPHARVDALQSCDESRTVHDRHDHVRHHSGDLGMTRREESDRLGSVRGSDHPVPERLQGLFRDQENRRVVVDDHDQFAVSAGKRLGIFHDRDSAKSGRFGWQVDVESVLETVMNPPWLPTMPCTVESPIPVPFPTSFVVKNGSKVRSMISLGMPSPVSLTVRTT